MPGFIHGELEQKILILYVLSRLAEPVPFDTVLDLSLCDEGISYFDFTERLRELVERGHVELDADECYSVTDKGRRTADICQEELPYTVRIRCDRNAEARNRVMKRQEQVRATVKPRPNGTFTVRMALDDDIGNLMDLQVVAPQRELAEHIVERFQRTPERIYSRLMDILVQESPDEPSGA